MHHFVFLSLLGMSIFFSAVTADPSGQNLSEANNAIKHSVFILYSGDNKLPSHVQMREGLLARLATRPANEKIDLYEEYLDGIRLNSTKDLDSAYIALWNKKYADVKMDMIVTVGPTAENFLNRHPELFSHLPRYDISISGFNQTDEKLRANLFKVINVVIQTLPDTARLIVIAKESKNASVRLVEHIRAVEPLLAKKSTVEIWSDFSFDELYSRAGQLPERTAILYFPVSIDRLGNREIPFNVVKKLVQVSSVPIFVHDDTYLGIGAVGGYLRSIKQEGDMIGRMMLGIAPPKTDEEYDNEVRGYFFDDNALKRWHIADKNLPPHSVIVNRQESRLYIYRWYIAAVLLALLIESALIVVLINSLRYRKLMTLALAEERNLLEVRVAERTCQLLDRTKELEQSQVIANLGSYILDIPSGVWRSSGVLDTLFGIDESYQRTVEGWAALIHPDDRAMMVNHFSSEVLAQGKSFDKEYRIIRDNDQGVRWVHGLGKVEFDDQQGQPVKMCGTIQDITAKKAVENEIERLAFYDPLTGLPNRRLLLDRLKPAFASSHRSDKKGALLFIDMDDFKTLNDTFGHDMGDLLLQQVAKRLLSCVREEDTVARFGGDEFVVMLEDLHETAIEAAKQAEVIGNKIISFLNQPYQLTSLGYHSTPSIGIVLFNGYQQSTDQLLKQADIAMYQAKAAGRNGLRFFDPQMQVSIDARVALEADLRVALKENQFVLYYQPQVYHNCQIIGAEVLIRWQHPQRGFISPAEFIPMAEDTGLILPVGQWVLKAACAQLKKWAADAHTEHLQLAVNVSARQFHQADFVERVRHIMIRSAINPERLKLELTESLVLDNIDDTIIKMNALREMGVRFSMDDFGTGYSSLSSLKKLPLSQLKIDQSFVRDLTIDPDDAVIVQTIIAMTRSLGMEVIAEGVETEAQRIFLEQHDCALYQGYLFSRPVPIEQFEQLLKSTVGGE